MSVDVERTSREAFHLLSKWIDVDIRLFPVMSTFMYDLDVEGVMRTIALEFEEVRGRADEIRADLSKVRRALLSTYIAVEEETGSPLSRMEEVGRCIELVDSQKVSVLRMLYERYCGSYERHIADVIKVSDVRDLIRVAVVLRSSSKDKVLQDMIVRYSFRLDKLNYWMEGVTCALRDLGYAIDEKELQSLLKDVDTAVRKIVTSRIPIGRAGYNMILIPSCIESTVDDLVKRYSNVKTILSSLKHG